jgi:hypothetical protein
MSQLGKNDLEALLRPQLGNDLVVESFTTQPLTQPGDNYGSIMLAIEVSVLQEADRTSSHNLSLVAKLVLPYGFLWKIFDPPNTVCKEINCYTLVKQEYEKLQNENCIPKEKFLDVFPRCYGARTTLSQKIGDKADKYGAILLENLKMANYHLGDRKVGLDLKHVQLAVSQLARFHALSVALKILKPQVFKDTVLKACKPQNVGFDEAELQRNVPKLMNVVKTIPGCEIYLDKIQMASESRIKIQFDQSLLPPKEPYATLCHTDFWVNNMMFCYESNNENIPVHIKFLDFQGVQYASPITDLIFFLYTSTAEGVRTKNQDDLIHLYHENFIDCLKDVGCDISPFTFKSLLDEIETFAPSEAHHILYMLMPICADKSEVPKLSEINFHTFYREPNDVFKRKAKEFIIDFVKRGWL